MLHKKEKWSKPHQTLYALNPRPIQAWLLEQASSALQDRFGFSHFFYPSGKPEGSRSGVAKGLQ
jgi:hypothetical protein